MLKLKRVFLRFSQFQTLYLSRIRSFIKLVVVAYNLYYGMMGLTKYQARVTSYSLCQNGSHLRVECDYGLANCKSRDVVP